MVAVALNYQTAGLMMDLNDGRFLANGACGYVLKPQIMRDEISYFSANTRDVIPGVSPQRLHVKVCHTPKITLHLYLHLLNKFECVSYVNSRRRGHAVSVTPCLLLLSGDQRSEPAEATRRRRTRQHRHPSPDVTVDA